MSYLTSGAAQLVYAAGVNYLFSHLGLLPSSSSFYLHLMRHHSSDPALQFTVLLSPGSDVLFVSSSSRVVDQFGSFW